MKNVLIISASPRKNGNWDMLCDRFAEGVLEGGHQVEKVFLALFHGRADENVYRQNSAQVHRNKQ